MTLIIGAEQGANVEPVRNSPNACTTSCYAHARSLPLEMSDSDEIYLHASFPIPYRALTLLSLGILGWATNVHGLHKFGVDVVSTMDLRADASARSIPTHNLAASHHPKPVTVYRTIYSIFSSFSIFSFLSWCLYRMNTRGDRTLVDYYGYIPVITVLAILLVLVCPYNVMFKEERERFLL